MSLSRALRIALACGLVSGVAHAQDDDLLAPLVPPSKTKPKAKPKPKPKVKQTKKPQKGPDLVVPLEPAKTELVLKLGAGTKGARFYLDGEELSSKGSIEVEPGEHTVTARRLGFADFSRTLTVREGRSVELPVALEPVAAVVRVGDEQPGVEVRWEGRVVGIAPMDDLLLPPGTHELTLSQSGHQTQVLTLTVKAGKEYALPSTLPRAHLASDRPERAELSPALELEDPGPFGVSAREASTPLLSRWYVWAGAAAVIAGATITTVVLTSQPAKFWGRDPKYDACLNCPAAGR